MSVAARVKLVIGVAHGLRSRLAEHNLEINRLEAVVHVAVDHARRTRDAFPRPELDVDAPPAFVLDEGGEKALQHEEHFFHFVRMRRISLARLDVHDAQREAARRNHAGITVLARAAGADEAVLRALVALDFCVLERGPVGLAVAETGDELLRDLLQRHAGELGRTGMSSCAHASSSYRIRRDRWAGSIFRSNIALASAAKAESQEETRWPPTRKHWSSQEREKLSTSGARSGRTTTRRR